VTGFIVAPERAKRPNDLMGSRTSCPFCTETPDPAGPILDRRMAADGEWLLAVPNAFPIFRAPDGGKGSAPCGLQEVVIEGSQHENRLSGRSPAWLSDLLKFWRDRMRALSEKGMQRVFAFRNEGLLAGGTLQHPHSQVAGLTSPLQTRDMSLRPSCADARLVSAREGLTLSVPEAPLADYHVCIAATATAGFFRVTEDAQLEVLGEIIAKVFASWRRIGLDPDHQITVIEDDRAWQMDIIPCTSAPNALERATGLRVLSMDPSDMAQALRAV